MNEHHGAQHHLGHDGASGPDIALAELLELDAQVLHSYLTDLTGWLAACADRAPARILDLGSGPGTGTLALVRRFPGASVTAVDTSPQMLHRLEEQATAHGAADRVQTLRADLDEEWPQARPGEAYDLMWTASFLHHLNDPDRGLAQAFDRLRPGGLLAVTEMGFFPRVLPDGASAGPPDLEVRLHAATNTQPPHEWSEHLRRAGFILDARRVFEIHVDGSQAGPALNRYAQLFLAKLRSHAGDALAVDDLAALDTLLDATQPNSIAHRRDLTVRTTRTTWLARRPAKATGQEA